MTSKLVTFFVFLYASLALAGDDKVVHAVNLQLTNSNTSFYTLMKSATLTANRQLIFPDNDGTGGYVLSTNGSGVLSWIANGGGLTIGNTVTGGTDGSVLFVGAGALAQNNANFFWDATNTRLGVGTNAPSSTFSTNNASGGFVADFDVAGVVYDRVDQFGRITAGVQVGTGLVGAVSAVASGADVNTPVAAQFKTTVSSPYGVIALESAADNMIFMHSDSSSANITLKTSPSGGSWNLTLPPNGGTVGAPLLTDGAGVSAWSPDIHDVAGKVGIGTSTPALPLDVVGSARITAPTGSGLQVTTSTATTQITLDGSPAGSTGILFNSTPSGSNRNWLQAISYDTAGGMSFVRSASAGAGPTLNSMTLTSDGKVGVGTTTPIYDLEVANDGGRAATVTTSYNNTAGTSANYIGRRARGSKASPTAVQTGDVIGSVSARGYGTTGFAPGATANVRFEAGENWTDTANGSYTTFFTTVNGGGPASASEKMRLTGDGRLGIGTAAPAGSLDITTPLSLPLKISETSNDNGIRFLSAGTGNHLYMQAGNASFSGIKAFAIDADGITLGRNNVLISAAAGSGAVSNSSILAKLQVVGDTNDSSAQALKIGSTTAVIASFRNDGRASFSSGTPFNAKVEIEDSYPGVNPILSVSNTSSTAGSIGALFHTDSTDQETNVTVWEAASAQIARFRANGRLVFGNAGDYLTNWYKSATGLLKTDGDVNIAGPGGNGGNVPHEVINRNGGTCNGDGSCPTATSCTCTCATNEILLSGGCYTGASSPLSDTFPVGSSWTCNYGVAANITAYAVCAGY